MLTRNSAQAGDYPLYYKIQTVIGGIAMHEEMIKEIVADYVEMRAEDIKLDDTLQSLGLDSLDAVSYTHLHDGGHGSLPSQWNPHGRRGSICQ